MSDVTPIISFVIPAYCEGQSLRRCVAAVQNEGIATGCTHEIILIDDGSKDETWEVIQDEARKSPIVRGFRFSRNFGKESALCAGLEMSRGQAVIMLDADMQHPPSLIPTMVRTWRETGANIVEAVKSSYEQESLVGRLRRGAFYVILSKFSGFDLSKASDFKLIDQQVRSAWLKMGEKNVFFRGMIAWLGFNREEVTFVVPEREGGKSKFSFFRLLRLAITGVTAFSALPMHLATLVGAIFMVFGVLMGIYAVILKMSGKAVEGFTTVIILQLLIGSLTLLTLGIIGEYIGRIYDEVKHRPRFIVSETTEDGLPTSAASVAPGSVAVSERAEIRL